MYVHHEHKDFAEFMLSCFGNSIKSQTEKIYHSIEVIKIKEEAESIYTSFFEKHNIPYKIRSKGEHAYFGDLSKLDQSASLFYKTFHSDRVEEERYVVQDGQKGLCYLTQYTSSDTKSKKLIEITLSEFLWNNNENELRGSFSSSVGHHNAFLFEEIRFSDEFCYFVADKKLSDRFKRISSKVLGFAVELNHLDVVNKTYHIDGLVWFKFKNSNRGNPNGTTSYKLLCALLDGEIRHSNFSDRDGEIKIDVRMPRGNHPSDNRISRSMYRDDLEANLKSSWEANFARILNHLGIEWEYEKETFRLNDEIFYTPDFFLPGNRIVEIKGFWDNESRKKVNAFIDFNKEYELYTIDGDMYLSLDRLYKQQIENWEDELISTTREVIPVVGITLPQRKKYVAALKTGEELFLKRDPENPYDKNAIQVLNQDGIQIGFISKEWASIYASKLDIGMKFNIIIRSMEDKVIKVLVERSNKEEDLIFDFLINTNL